MKKKILYVITKSVWGGAQRYVFDLATNLPKDRFDVAVAVGGRGRLIQKLHNAEISVITIPHLERDIKPFKEILSLWSLFKIFRENRPDVVHLNSSKIGGLGAVAAKLARVPKIVFTVHGWGFNDPRLHWQKAVIIFLSRLAALFQNHLIHVSRRDLTATATLNIAPPEKCEYIPLGISQLNFSSRTKARSFFIKQLGLAHDAKIIGAVAELTKNKGLVHLVDAVNQVEIQNPESRIQTVIIGDGEDKEKLQNQIRALGLENTIHLTGFIPDAAKYLKAFDAFVLPSLKEGLPYTVLEALHAGLPVVATNVGGIPDIIEQEKNGIIVPSKDSTALAEAIIYLFAHQDLCKSFAKGAAKKIGVYSSFSNMVEKTCALYES